VRTGAALSSPTVSTKKGALQNPLRKKQIGQLRKELADLSLVNRARSKDRARLNFLKQKRQGTLVFAFLLWYHILATQINK